MRATKRINELVEKRRAAVNADEKEVTGTPAKWGDRNGTNVMLRKESASVKEGSCPPKYETPGKEVPTGERERPFRPLGEEIVLGS